MSTSLNPTRSLPNHPSEEFLHKEAKRFAREHGLQLAAAQRELAHEYGYRNWVELMDAVIAFGSDGGPRDPNHDAKLRKIRRLIAALPADETVVFQDEVDINLNPKIGAC